MGPEDVPAARSRGGGSKKIAALYDIHGNPPALKAALAAASSEADLLVVGGDVPVGFKR